MRKVFYETIVTYRGDGKCHVDYGPSLGSQLFDDPADATAELDKWSAQEIDRLVKQLAGMTKLRRYLK